MKMTISTVAVLLLLCAHAEAGPIVWQPADGGNGHTYNVIYVERSISWQDARAAAEALGGHLATLTTVAENEFVASLIALAPDLLDAYWLGGYQKNPMVNEPNPADGWAWVTGEYWDPLFAADRWAVGEPNNGMGGTQHYLHYWPTLPEWDDMENRNTMRGYVVEYSAVPEPSTLALFGIALIAMSFMRRRSTN